MRLGSLRSSQVAQASVIEQERTNVAVTPLPQDAVALAQSRGSRATRLLPHLAVLAAFTVLSIVATWPLFPQLGGFVLDKGDPLYSVWAMAWQAHALATQPANLFNSNILYPFQGTLTFDELSFSEALLAAPFYWLLGNPVLSHNLVLFTSFVFSGYTMWLLVRELSGSNRAGMVAGAAFAFCFYRMNHLPHITLDTTQFMPLVLLSCYKLLWTRQWRWAAALGGWFAIQALAGHYLAFYSAMLVGLFVVYYGIAQRRIFSRAFFGKMAVGLAASLLVILPIAVPYVRDQGKFEFKRSLFEAERFSNTLSSFLALFRGSPAYRSLLAPFADPGPWSIERAAFPGFAVLLLAGAGLLLSRRYCAPGRNVGEARGTLRLHAGFYGLVAVLSAFLSLGPSLQITYAASNYDPAAIQRVLPLPYALLHEYAPGFQSMRVVARIDILTALGLSVLAGLGAFMLLQLLGRHVVQNRRARRFVPLVAAMLVLLPVAESWSAPIHMEPVGTRDAVPPVYKWLAQQPHTVILEYPMTNYRHGDPSVEMANLYQYYSVYHWHDTINGSTTIRPFSYSALVAETEKCFPCPRSLGAISAMGARYVVVHLDNLSEPQRTDFEWRSTNPAGKVLDDFVLVQSFGPDLVYALKGPQDAQSIAGILPQGASLLLAGIEGDPMRENNERVAGGYLAALAWYLRDHPQFGSPEFSFGQTINTPEPNNRPDFALLWAGQAPEPFGYKSENQVWANEHVALYKRGLDAVHAGSRR